MLDASTVISATLTPNGTARRAIEAARAMGQIALSDAVFAEISGVLGRPKFARTVAPHRRWETLRELSDGAIWLDPVEAVTECRDAKDNSYLELAIAARAAAIITGDSDLLVLNPWRTIRIVRPAQFLALVAQSEA